MRIVIDLQGAQSESRYRGIGRYSLALALGMARNAGRHEVWLVLNAALGGAIDDIRQAFAGLVPAHRICVFDIPVPAAEAHTHNSPRARAGELLREYAIAQLRPDAVLITSLFEGFVDDAVVSIGTLAPESDGGALTAAIMYDLIPFLNPGQYLRLPEQRSYYERKIASLRRAGLLLAISDYSRQEAIDALELDPAHVVSISTAVDDSFHPAPLDPGYLAALRARFGITRAALMCAPGGFDSRKNIDGLIAAYAMLPAPQRAAHQLVIAGKINDGERQRLADLARQHGLAPDELVLTGYVSDADLIDLYRSCALFIFPSLHEGFGLPALEAMACGALTIGADATSIPEVIGNPDALFDGRRPEAIATKIGQVLGDPALQARLREHAVLQARKFSWDNSARRALAALEAQVAARALVPAPAPTAPSKPRIAFLSPLPPERTGVADYAVRVLPTLLPHFEVELIVHQEKVELPPELAHLPCHPLAWLDQHPERYQHIVYQFGNSPFHSHMMPLLQRHPGVVVLHDFFLSSMISYEQITGAMPGVWTRSLLHSHGYAAVQSSIAPDGLDRTKQDYPCNLEILQDASHVIVHSEYARQLARDWYGPRAGEDWSPAQLPRAVPLENDRAAARRALGIADDTFLVCNFGFIAPTKHCLELLQAWLASRLHRDARCQLVFVGANHGGDYGRQMTDTIAAAGAGERVKISGWTSDEDYFRYLQAADIGVQLRTSSRGETSGTVLDCMIYGLPVIINANGAMAEFPHDAVWMLPDAFGQPALVEALETLHDDAPRRRALGAAGFALMGTRNSPERVGLMYKQALAVDAGKQQRGRAALLRALLSVPGLDADDAMLQRLARCVARSPDPLQPRQLLVDVTHLATSKLKTGIERVVRSQLLELMRMRAIGLRIEPVYFDSANGRALYRYARNYAAALLGIDGVLQGPDPVVDVQAGDVFYAADYSTRPTMAAATNGVYAAWRARGVSINFLVHDLLPVQRPEFFPAHSDTTHAAWLDCIAAEGDCLIGVSAAVRDDLDAWLVQRAAKPGWRRRPNQRLTALHHGADFELQEGGDGPSSPLVRQVAARPSFLMVGTIEPRKGHLQALDAFEQLWAENQDVNLVIVGREGWKGLPDAERRTLPRIMQRLRAHPELGKRLLWLDDADDDALRQIYRASTCLLFPSEGEGFGLPLIEAAHHGLPLLVRDLPVFSEVAGEHATYFSGLDGGALAHAVRAWMALHADGRHPLPDGMTWMTWQQQAGSLLTLLLEPQRPRQLLLDVTTIARNDLGTGIERVVRNQLLELLQLAPAGYRIEPVYLDNQDGRIACRYARRYAQRLAGRTPLPHTAEPVVEVQAGDIYYCADFAPHAVTEAAQAGLFAHWRGRGVSVNFTVYDLLPVRRPEFFPPHADAGHLAWLDCVSREADSLICISQAVCDDLAAWQAEQGVTPLAGQRLTALHLGADLELKHEQGLSGDAPRSPLVQQIEARPSFLMVGTIEPRKGHLQALEAFEQLWAAGVDVNLVIVGREGWKPLPDADRRTLPRIMERLRGSPERGKRLLWLDGIDDDTLHQVYRASTCLLFASEGEGFGLPLIEAAHQGLPLLARDLPVFREVAGEHAHYFSGLEGAALAGAVREWLALHAEGRHPSSRGMTWMTWREQARALLALLTSPEPAAATPGAGAETVAPAPGVEKQAA